MLGDSDYMLQAIGLARKGVGFTSPNPMVGAVLVKNGLIAGEGYHAVYGGPHAEVLALAAAGDNAKGATLYVTLEPCAHYGKTPPCVEAILKAGVTRVVIAMMDPNPVAKGGAEILREHGITVETGVCEAEAQKLNRAFVHYIKTRRPYVVAKCAMTLDGYIATMGRDSKWITGEQARYRAHEMRHELDAILVGSATVRADNPSLTARLNIPAKDPVRLVMSPYADVDPKANVFTVKSDAEAYVVVADKVSPEKLLPLQDAGLNLITLGSRGGGMDLGELLDKLGAMNIMSLLVEGGSMTLSSFFKAGLVNECRFFYAPKILGGEGLSPTCGGGPALIRDAFTFYGTEAELLGEDVLITAFRQLRVES